MSKIQIETAQNVQLYQNVARLGSRIAAYFIDLLVIIAYEIMMFYIYSYHIYNNISDTADSWVITLVFGLPPFLYHLLFETFNNGRSLGKAAVKIRVVRLDGTPPKFSNYLIRWLMRILDISMTSGALAIFAFLLNGKGQRLGDIAAKTTVISENNKISLSDTFMENIPENHLPKYPQVTVFSDAEMQEIKNLYKNAKRNNDVEILQSLAQKITKIMQVQTEEIPIVFIQQVIRDYNYYTQQ